MKPRLFLLNPTVRLRARVNMASVTYPVDELTFDTVTAGDIAFPQPGHTVLLGSAAGLDDYGRTRVRRVINPIPGTALPVGRSSIGTHDGQLTVVDNAYITVLDLHQVWAKISFIDDDGVEYKDSDIAAGDYQQEPPPKANAGIGYAGTIDPVSGVVTVEFDAGDSWQWDDALSNWHSGVADYNWNVKDGTITVGVSTGSEITATFPAGFRYVDLMVTDDNGNDHTMHIPVYARDPDDDDSIEAFQITAWNEGIYGTEIDVLVLEDIPRSTYPDGTLAMIWDDENPPDTSPGRVHMMFIGWIQTEDLAIAPQRTGNLRDTVLHLVDVAGRLKRLPAWPQVMEYAPGLNDWAYTDFPVVMYYIWFQLYWHSTALEVADLRNVGAPTLSGFEFKVLSSDAGNLFDQANSLALNTTPDHHLTCHRHGQLMMVPDPLLVYVDDRSSALYQYFQDLDWANFRYNYQRPPRVHQLRSYAVSGGSTTITTLQSLAPGNAPGQGEGYIETSQRIALSQFDLNYVEGNRYARMNSRMGPIQLDTMPSELVDGFSPAYMGWIGIFFQQEGNVPQRGSDFYFGGELNQATRCICQQAQWRFDYQRTGLVVSVTLTLEAETSGPPAITLTLDEEE